ncbi:MAG: hypothetical protein IPH07_26105 [Deltaproteobacteria bacterium]|nr:hypothetical protein [Deltaproteobacteria bacterium]
MVRTGRGRTLRVALLSIGALSPIACDVEDPASATLDTGSTGVVAPRDAASQPPQRVAATERPPAPQQDDAVELPSSWDHYPELPPSLTAAVRGHARADVVLRELADALAPHRWAAVEDWDNTGFVRTAADGPRGFVVRRDGRPLAQDPGEYQLGCAGGFLEGVRAILVPSLEMDDLAHCDAAALASLGAAAPATCAAENFGLHAIAAVAAAVERNDAAIAPPEFVHLEPRDVDDLAPLLRPGVVHVCTASHASGVELGTRYHHHMMILLRTPGRRALQMFDTTGFRGVALRELSTRALLTYLGSALSTNAHHHYDPDSTELDCFAITRRR